MKLQYITLVALLSGNIFCNQKSEMPSINQLMKTNCDAARAYALYGGMIYAINTESPKILTTCLNYFPHSLPNSIKGAATEHATSLQAEYPLQEKFAGKAVLYGLGALTSLFFSFSNPHYLDKEKSSMVGQIFQNIKRSAKRSSMFVLGVTSLAISASHTWDNAIKAYDYEKYQKSSIEKAQEIIDIIENY